MQRSCDRRDPSFPSPTSVDCGRSTPRKGCVGFLDLSRNHGGHWSEMDTPSVVTYLWHQQGDSCDQQLESHAHQVGPNNPATAWAELRGPIAPLPSCFVGLHIIPDSPGDDEKKRRRKVPLPVDYTAGLKVIHGVIQNRDPAEGWL